MTSVQERLKLKRAPTDIWSIREQLCLASSVLKSGDQNWMSVSRSLRPIADKDCTRPLDWFSQKSCAQQYAYLLENTDIPKRKKRESGETTSESIVRRLTQDRISELSKILTIQREEYQQLKNEVTLLKNGIISDEKLQKIWLAIEQEQKEQEQKNKAHIVWLTKRQQSKELQALPSLTIQSVQKKIIDISTENLKDIETSIEDEDKKNKCGRSSLLTSLLKSPSPTTQMQVLPKATGSPTIASLLGSSPKVPASTIMQNVSPQLHQLVSSTVSNVAQERPSASAPTLSMLLEQPATGAQKSLQQQLQGSTNLLNSKNLQNTVQIQNTVQTRSACLGHVNSQISQIQHVITDSNLSNTEIPQIIHNPIDEVMPKVLQMDKDEINEIIGDIEELIKEEITGSPQTQESSSRTVEIIDNLNVQASNELIIEHSKLRNVDEPVSLSNSPTSEISIEEIDSSTSNIAEIIGTAIETVESKTSKCDVLKEKKEIQEARCTSKEMDKEIVESTISEELKIEIEITEVSKQAQTESDAVPDKVHILESKEIVFVEEENKKDNNIKEGNSDNELMDCTDICEKEFIMNKNIIENIEKTNQNQELLTSEVVNIFLDQTNISLKLEEKNDLNQCFDKILKNEKLVNDSQVEETKNIEENASTKNINDLKISSKSEAVFTQINTESVSKVINEVKLVKDYQPLKQDSNTEKKNKDSKQIIEESDFEIMSEKKDDNEMIKKELDLVIDCEISEKVLHENLFVDFNNEKVLKKEKIDDSRTEKIKEIEITDKIKIELKKEDIEDNDEELKQEKGEIKKEIENNSIKKERLESIGNVEELDEEEPTLSKLSGGRVMKTYSKKQNATVDSEPENENGGETADYRAWKKSIMLVYNRLATHKYASIFLRPITEDQAPGYHSIIFRPMDLWTIKKNIDNGTIRSTTHFQRDIMLMFQNAIMFNKYNTLVHKMTLEMQEECLQHMQVLVRAAGEASFRRETRTAASISNEGADNNLKRKWTHISSSPHYEIESSRMKKRRKSEND